jgi:uroporphyrinogen-III decarboxylase
MLAVGFIPRTLFHLDDLDKISQYEIETDGFASLTLHRIKMHRQRIKMHRQRIRDAGYILPMITSRGPLCTAGFVRGTTEFMIDIVENPDGAHRLIDLCTKVVIDWLKAQHKVMGDSVESIFILDDIVGFINEDRDRGARRTRGSQGGHFRVASASHQNRL